MANVSATARPNIVFLVVESTDGRTWQKGYQNDVIPLPSIRRLEEHGAAFHRHYSNAPVCCPSRATFWSGRHAHKIPHHSHLPGSKINVSGAWNNYEGLPPNFDDKISDVLGRAGYAVNILGKRDWTAGSHTLNVQLNSWTMYTRFPYNISANGGWNDEVMCSGNGSVRHGGGPRGVGSAHADDWKAVEQGVEWIRNLSSSARRLEEEEEGEGEGPQRAASGGEEEDDGAKPPPPAFLPFFLYQGMNIVHPPYVTNEYYMNQIDPSKITVPRWLELEEMHPCDLQASMLKGCIGSSAERKGLEAVSRRRRIRQIYYSMVAEFDEMVGTYMDAVQQNGLWDSTVWIVTSDHGDMQLEHRQFYKMVPRDPSSSVPMVIMDGRRHAPGYRLPPSPGGTPGGKVVTQPTQLIDIFPTIMEFAGVDASHLPLDGTSLVPFLQHQQDEGHASGDRGGTVQVQFTAHSTGSSRMSSRPPFVTSQFHGCNLAMSWFLIVQIVGTSAIKYIAWGTGAEVPNQMFNLTSDPGEFHNLLDGHPSPHVLQVASTLATNLKATIDYPKVAQDVAQYNLDSFRAWANHTPDWEAEIHKKNLRWTKSWDYDAQGAINAVRDWMQQPASVLPCRDAQVWPKARRA